MSGLWKTRRSSPIRLDRVRLDRVRLDQARRRLASPDRAPSGRRLPSRLPTIKRLPAGLLTGADLVVVDVETTGWLADSASITEIGAVRLASDQPAREFSALVNPGTPIPPAITALTGITDHMVAAAPPIGDVLPRFIEFARDSVIVAHNAPFDLGFLTAACAANGIDWPPSAVIDTAVLARLLLTPGAVPDHKLTTLAGYFGTGTDPCHRALADAKATAGVLGSLLSLAVRYDCAAAGNHARRSWRRRMVTAIVLIKADVTRIPETAEAIAQISEVSEVYSVTGEFDLVAMVRVRGHDELGDVIPGRLNRVPGVTHTETHIAFRTYSRHDLEAAFSLGYPEQS